MKILLLIDEVEKIIKDHILREMGMGTTSSSTCWTKDDDGQLMFEATITKDTSVVTPIPRTMGDILNPPYTFTCGDDK